jgi:spermidine synthase/uncharacterized membrane protein
MTKRAGIELLAASFVVLALELALIRWMPAQVRVIAYFPNLVLISAFLGLGLGCLMSRRLPLWVWPVSVGAGAAIVAAMSGVIFTHNAASEFLWLLYFDLPKDAPVVRGIRLPIVVVFLLGAAMFISLGSVIAERLRIFREAGRPLAGYAFDLGGSLLGVAMMSLLFFSGARPVMWFAVIFGVASILFLRSRRDLAVLVLAAVATLAVVQRTDQAQLYSPYYAISTRAEGGHVVVLTNGSVHQDALPLRKAANLVNELPRTIREGYHLPYGLLGRPPRKVLILGAGTGNDVSVALDNGAQSIDAVEIDPEILKLGRMHPDRPYESTRVNARNTDARAFLNYSKEKYDLIVFGTLDSMTRLSALSNVRLDNFVYTVECIEAAKKLLTPDGGIVLYFRVAVPYVEEHIAAMLARALDERPHIIRTDYSLFNRIFLAGPAFARLNDPAAAPATGVKAVAETMDAPTDDWPFLYLNGRGVSPFYLSLMAVILAIAAVSVLLVSREMRTSLRSGAIDVEMFLFGLAFLLMETKLVTEMNLVWGATWLTSAVVFGSILLMILVATLATQRWSVSWPVATVGLVVTLLAAWFVPVELIVGTSLPVRLAASVLYVGVPIAFASVCFALLFRERKHPDVAFGWNMLGAVAGGLLEFASMAIGIKALTLLALAAYLLAFLHTHRGVPVMLRSDRLEPE